MVNECQLQRPGRLATLDGDGDATKPLLYRKAFEISPNFEGKFWSTILDMASLLGAVGD